ncbi:prophage antirepressor [Elysia marginata]|uniref:Prophage antirepressor n=1 Tax=Elysia marginata TaxID=1093978 RepID=A0AAV4GFV0_9GAST|nr:prophage antirepressor [Elysia marginata]
MKDLQLFNYEDHQIRVVGTVEEPLFVAKDVCKALGYKEWQKTIKRLDEDEVTLVGNLPTSDNKDINRGNKDMLCITESGVYHLVFKSKMEGAKAFRKWVTSEVLPSIRKTGGYGVSGVNPTFWYYEVDRDNFLRSIIGITSQKERVAVYESWKKHYSSQHIQIKEQ